MKITIEIELENGEMTASMQRGTKSLPARTLTQAAARHVLWISDYLEGDSPAAKHVEVYERWKDVQRICGELGHVNCYVLARETDMHETNARQLIRRFAKEGRLRLEFAGKRGMPAEYVLVEAPVLSAEGAWE